MKNLLSSLNIFNWPIWLKLAGGFLVAVAVPVILLVIVAQNGFTEISTQNLRAYIQEQSTRQQREIDTELRQSQAVIAEFLASENNVLLINQVIEEQAQQDTTVQKLGVELQERLRLTDRFPQFYVLDRTGNLLLLATNDRISTSEITLSTQPAYEQANTALLQNQDQSITISNDPIAVQITYAVRNESGGVSGFLVGTLDHELVIANPLQFTNQTYPAYSYLITSGDNPVVISPEINAEAVQRSIVASTIIPLALRGTSGIDVYAIGAERDIQVVGRYTPIFSPISPTLVLFALITEASADIPLTQATSYFNSARLFPILIGVTLLFILMVVLFNQIITPSLANLRLAMQGLSRGDFEQPVTGVSRGDEIGAVSAAFLDMRVQVRNLLDDLEARVAARTRDIAATQEISRFAATQRNLQTLLDQVVQLIIEQFPNIYHAQIFLLDSDRQYAMLRASTGEPGKILLARGHRLQVGSVSVIGQMIEQEQIIIARDVVTSQVHKRNEFLPDTRTEVAIPLRVADQIIGALDVQSKYRNAFTEDEVKVLQTMADQIAVAIENARLYQEAVRRLEDIERSNRMATLTSWQEYIYGQRQRGLTSEAGNRTDTDMSELRRKALSLGQVVTGTPTRNNTIPIAVPIQLRGQTLGAVEWEIPADDLNINKIQLAQELANRLAVSLDNARLFEESQRATERERVVNAIAAKLTPQTEISEILQTAVREVGQALRSPQVSIRLQQPSEPKVKDSHVPNAINGSNGANGSHE